LELHVGSDLFSAALAVSLLCVFAAALAHTYNVHSERESTLDDFELLLDAAEQLRAKVLVSADGRLGLIEISRSRVESYVQTLKINGIDMCVEIVSLDGEQLLAVGLSHYSRNNYFSSQASASFPVTVKCENGSTRLCELVVKIWRV